MKFEEIKAKLADRGLLGFKLETASSDQNGATVSRKIGSSKIGTPKPGGVKPPKDL